MNGMTDSDSLRDQVFNFITRRLDSRLNKLQALQFSNDRTLHYVREKVGHFSQQLGVKNVYKPVSKPKTLQDEIKGYFSDLKEGRVPPNGKSDDEDEGIKCASTESLNEEPRKVPKLSKVSSTSSIQHDKLNTSGLKKDKSTHSIPKTERGNSKSSHVSTMKRTGSKTRTEHKLEWDDSKSSLKKLDRNDRKTHEVPHTTSLTRSRSGAKIGKQVENINQNSARNKSSKKVDTDRSHDANDFNLETASTERERITTKKTSKSDKNKEPEHKDAIVPKLSKKKIEAKISYDESVMSKHSDRSPSSRLNLGHSQKQEKSPIREGTAHPKKVEEQHNSTKEKNVRSRTPVPKIGGIENINKGGALRLEATPVKKKRSTADHNENSDEHRGDDHNKSAEKSVDRIGEKSPLVVSTGVSEKKKSKKSQNAGDMAAEIATPCFSGAYDATLQGINLELAAQKQKNSANLIMNAEERLEKGIFSFDSKEMDYENLLSNLDQIEEKLAFKEFREEIRVDDDKMTKKKLTPVKAVHELSGVSGASGSSDKKVKQFSETASSRKRKLELNIEMIEKEAVESWEKNSDNQDERDCDDALVNADYDPNVREEEGDREILKTEETNENPDAEPGETELLESEAINTEAQDSERNEDPDDSNLQHEYANEEDIEPNDTDFDPNDANPKEAKSRSHPDQKEKIKENIEKTGTVVSNQEAQDKQNKKEEAPGLQSEKVNDVEAKTEVKCFINTQKDNPNDFSFQNKDVMISKAAIRVDSMNSINEGNATAESSSKKQSELEIENAGDSPQGKPTEGHNTKTDLDPNEIALRTEVTEKTKLEKAINQASPDMISKADKIEKGGDKQHETEKSEAVHEPDSSKIGREEHKESKAEGTEEAGQLEGNNFTHHDKAEKKFMLLQNSNRQRNLQS